MTKPSNSTLFAFLLAAVFGFVFGGCNCGPIRLPYGVDGGCTPGIDCPVEGTCVEGSGNCTPTGLPCCTGTCLESGACGTDPGPTCLAANEACTQTGTGLPCCSGNCNSLGQCASEPIGGCKLANEACTQNLDCCNGNPCVNGICSTQQCRDVDEACSTNNDCCTLTCGADGLCKPLASGSTLKVIGQSCTTGAECASYNCQGGICVKAYNCQAEYDICTRDGDCCTNQCSSNDGTAGYCMPFSGGCAVEGTPCGGDAPIGASNCCTRICIDYGTGQSVCASGSGCKIEGTTCTQTSQCCGSYTLPKPDVVCEPEGRCGGGTGCNAVGNRCSPGLLADGGVVKTNAQNAESCCDGDKDTCKVDRAGVPRCFGGQTTNCPGGYTGVSPCCIAEGDFCSFSDQCCDGRACLPRDSDGRYVCTAKSTCDVLGTACDPTLTPSPCCDGSDCLPTSEITYACQLPPENPDGGTTCVDNGSACTSSSQCCSQICSGGFCQAPVACQEEKAACTADTDCCTGLACVIPPGSSSGTCELSSCQSSGQTCSPTLACCSGLKCVDGVGLDCTGADPCSCQVILQ